MKYRYLVFKGNEYYPSGGWDDLYDKAVTLEDAHTLITKEYGKFDWCQIVDLQTMTIIEDSRENKIC